MTFSFSVIQANDNGKSGAMINPVKEPRTKRSVAVRPIIQTYIIQIIARTKPPNQVTVKHI